ncbi:hypothetical protein BT69DRAFT_1277806 [Atractiella rhizophila]|nr:hypothetical protein BT69DRAFT_1277806 [Atractiella rhizophila]
MRTFRSNASSAQNTDEVAEIPSGSMAKQKLRGMTWQRCDGVPILGSRKVRQVLLGAFFPEFYTAQELDLLHNLLDEEWSAKCDFFAEKNVNPHENKLAWRFEAGYFDAIRWTGSRLVDPFGLSPWWAGGISCALLNEMPREYKKHDSAYMEVRIVVNLMIGVEKRPLR